MDGKVRAVVLSLLVALLSLEVYVLLSARAEARDAQIVAAEAEAVVNEPLRLRRKWGPTQYSWHYEELFIREFFQDRRGGVFLDVGAYHFSRNSNTYFLEKNLGWTGIAVDAQEEYREGYLTNRPGTKFFTYFVSDVSGDEADLFVDDQSRMRASGNRESATEDGEVTQVVVPTITLDDLLSREGIGKIDFLTMDIELSEPAALRGFDIERFKPDLVCIESLPPVADFISEYFSDHGYVRIELWSRMDAYNEYYALPGLFDAGT